jgi:hypothetical protein
MLKSMIFSRMGSFAGRQESLHDLVYARFELRDRERLFQERQRAGIPPHGVIVRRAAPLGVHGHFCSVDAPMERRGNETWRAVDHAIGCSSEKIDKSLLVSGLDREDIYQCDSSVFFVNLFHATPPFEDADKVDCAFAGTRLLAPASR